MRVRRFLRDFGGHIVGAVGLVVALFSLWQSQKAHEFARIESERAEFVGLSFVISDECEVTTAAVRDGVLLQEVVFETTSPERAVVRVNRPSDKIALAPLVRAATSAITTEIQRTPPTEGQIEESRRTRRTGSEWTTWYSTHDRAYEMLVPVAVTYRVEAYGHPQTYYSLMDARVGVEFEMSWNYGHTPPVLQVTAVPRCRGFVLNERFDSEAELNEALVAESAALQRFVLREASEERESIALSSTDP